jgi:multicomponent Na+:H+ antiporter subunit B
VRDYLVLSVVAKLMIAFMLVFALYVQFHADFGPGGGFQAGVIAAAAIIFYAIIYGLPAARKVVPEWLVETMVAAGVLLYASVGVAGMLHRGIFWVEVGVLVTVAGVMLKIFYMFAGRPIEEEDGE